MTALAAESRRRVEADLESEGTCCRSEERVCGSQCPNAPISIHTSSDIIPFVSRSLKACWYISLLSFLDLALRRLSAIIYYHAPLIPLCLIHNKESDARE